MAGVVGPMLRYDHGGGTRFLVGLVGGGMAAGLALAVPAYVLGSALQAVAPMQARLSMLAAVCLLLGLFDLINRTPHVSRQVPQELVHRLQPGSLGVVWGFDLGLLFTTQKIASLIWVALAAVILLDPVLAAAFLVGIAVLASLAIAAWTIRPTSPAKPMMKWELRWQTRMRQASGLTMLVLAVLTSSQALQA